MVERWAAPLTIPAAAALIGRPVPGVAGCLIGGLDGRALLGGDGALGVAVPATEEGDGDKDEGEGESDPKAVDAPM